MSFPLNYEASVTMGISFVKTWLSTDPTWNAKDIIVLFYNDHDSKTNNTGNNYSKSVREFLKHYYTGHTSYSNDDILNLMKDNTKIHGRCGYLR